MRGSEARLLSVVACLHAKLLDRSRPLWALHVIDGLADGGLAVFARLHHALLDGQGAVALARVLLDIAPGVPIPAHEIGRAHAELQSLMRISYAVFCLKKKTQENRQTMSHTTSKE